MKSIIQSANPVLLLRIILVMLSAIFTFLFLYMVWYIVRGRFKKNDTAKQTAEHDKDNKTAKANNKNSPDYCALNEIMGYEFITIQHVAQSQEKTEENEPERGADWNGSKSPFLNNQPKALDVTSSQAEKDILEETPPDPDFRRNNENTEIQPANSSENRATKDDDYTEKNIEISEDMARAMSTDYDDPWPKNSITDDPEYIEWLISGYEEKNNVETVDPEHQNESDENDYSLGMMNEPDFDQMIADNENETDKLIHSLNLD